jgi:S1-C subfamily serine protease
VIAFGATSALLVAAALAAAATSGSGDHDGVAGGAVTTVPPYTFASTGTADLPALARPPEGVVRLVAVTPWGTRVSAGVVLDNRGTIATTAGAVADASTLVAYLADGGRVPAVVLGTDDDSGAAVVSISASPLPAASGWAVTLADGDRVHTGDERMTAAVKALGVSAISSDGRGLNHLVSLDPMAGGGHQPDDDHIAEGTPLLDDSQQVIGLCTYGRDDTMYAVPIEIPRAAARSIAVHGRVIVPWLGVSGDDRAADGAVVGTATDGSPAAKAGITGGDVIVAVDGQPVTSMAVLALSLRDYDVGAMVDLTYVRGGVVRHTSVVLGERRAANDAAVSSRAGAVSTPAGTESTNRDAGSTNGGAPTTEMAAPAPAPSR